MTVTTKSGDKFEGICSHSTPDSNDATVTLSMAKIIHTANEGQTNGVTEHESSFVGSGSNYVMGFNMLDVVDVAIPDLSMPDAVRSQNGMITLFGSTFRLEEAMASSCDESHE